jgi:hypothetical protein
MAKKRKLPIITITFDNKKWVVSTAKGVHCKCPKKETALKRGKALAKRKKAELYIYKKNGGMQSRHTYGRDPYPPKG